MRVAWNRTCAHARVIWDLTCACVRVNRDSLYMRVCACKSGQLIPPRMQGLLPLGMAAHPSAAKVKYCLKKMLSFCVGGVHMLGWAWPSRPSLCACNIHSSTCAHVPGVRVTFIILHAHTACWCTISALGLTCAHVRFLPFLITNYRVLIPNFIE